MSERVIDAPFPETKEELGYYVVNCASRDEALDIAKDVAPGNPGGAYEI